PYLNKSSNALRALLDGPDAGLEPLLTGVPVWRSTVVRAVKSAQLLRASFGETRAGSAGACVHSQRSLVSNDTHWMKLCRSTPQREQRASGANGSDNRLPQRAQRQTLRAAIRFGVFGPEASCSTR